MIDDNLKDMLLLGLVFQIFSPFKQYNKSQDIIFIERS